MKRILSLVLVLCMLVSLFPAAMAANTVTTGMTAQAADSYNLLVNPGGEEVDTASGTIPGWKLGNKATYMTNNPVAGTYGFALNKSGDYIQQTVTVPETTTYKLTGYLSGSGTMGIYEEDGTVIATASRNVKAYENLVIDNVALEAGQTVLIKIIRVAGVSSWLNADEFVFATTGTYDYVAAEGTIRLIADIANTAGTAGYLGAILTARENYEALAETVKPGVYNYEDLLAAEAVIDAQYTPYNLLVNPDLEYVSPTLASDSAKAITGWTMYGKDCQWATNNPYSGIVAVATNSADAYVEQTVVIPETAAYTLSGYIAGNGTFGLYDAAGNVIASISHGDSAYSYEIMENISLTAGDVVTVKCTRGANWLNADNFIFAADGNYKAVRAAMCVNRINAIDGKTGEARQKAVAEARAAYDALDNGEKALVTNYAKLQAAENEKVQSVIDQIAALGEITADSRPAVEAARAAFDALSKEEQEKVLNAAALEAAEARLIELGAVIVQRQTPLMGWSSWNCYYDQIDEDKIKLQAEAMVSTGLADAGYIYCNIDDTWQGGRSAETGLVVNGPEKFPSGMKQVADHIHSLGLKAGIYSDAGPNTCASNGRNEGADGTGYGLGVGLYEHEYEDLYQYFVDWGYDYIKVDFCGGRDFKPNPLDRETQYTKIGKCIEEIERIKGSDVVFNVCCWQWPGEWVVDVGDSVRIASDIRPVWSYVLTQVNKALPLAKYVGPGFAADLDMLEVGNGMTLDEDKSHFAMWCMLSAPLVLGNDLTRITDETLEIVSNEELIALNQDPAVIMATVAKTENNVQTWVKPLGSEDSNEKAVALFNMNNTMTTATVRWDEVGFTGDVEVRDLYAHKDLTVGDSYTVVLPAHGCVVLKVTGESSYSNETVIHASLTTEGPALTDTLDWVDVAGGTSRDNAYVIGAADETAVEAAAVSTGRVAYVSFTTEDSAVLTATLNGKEASDVFTGSGVYAVRYTGTPDGGDLKVAIDGGVITAVSVTEDTRTVFTDTELLVSSAVRSGEIDLTKGDYVSFAGENGTIAGGSLSDFVTAEGAKITGSDTGAVQTDVFDYFEVYLPAADTLTRADIYYGLVNGSATAEIRSGDVRAEADLYNITGGEDGVITVWYTAAEDVTVVLTLDNTFAGDGALRLDAVTVREETGVVLTNPEVAEQDGILHITAQTRGNAASVQFVAEVYDKEGTQVASNTVAVTLGGQISNTVTLPAGYAGGHVKMYLTDGAVIGDVYTAELPPEAEGSYEYQPLIGNLLAKKLVAEGAVLLDVRSAEEYAAGHIEGAIHIPYTDLLAEAEGRFPDKSTGFVVYCSAGKRSTQAQLTLNTLGYANVYNIGSMDNWYIEPTITFSLPNALYLEPGAEVGVLFEANPYEKNLETYYSLGKDSTFADAQPVSSPAIVTLGEDGWVKGYFVFEGELVATVEKQADLFNWDVAVYLSDLFDTWTRNESSYKAARADVSIDGKTLTVAGTPFTKGIGAHASSVVECAIPAGMARFVAIAGVDNEVNSGHTRNKVRYAVYVDDVLYADSGDLFRGEYHVFDVAFPVDAQTIRLEADQTDDGTNYDHADWGVAGFCARTAADGHAIRVTNGTASAETASWGEVITLTADEPANGKQFDKWVAETEGVAIADVYAVETTMVMPNADVAVTATYRDDPVELVKAAALEELEALRKALPDADYTTEQVTELNEICAAGAAAMEAAETVDGVNAALDAAKAALNAAVLAYQTVNTKVPLVLTGPDTVLAYEETATYVLSGRQMTNLATVHLEIDVPTAYLAEPVAQAADGWYIVVQVLKGDKLTVVAANNDGANGDGDILTLTVKPVKKAGEAALAVSFAELGAYLGEEETFVSTDLTRAALTVQVRYNVCDVNHDGVVNLLDMTRAQRWYDTDNADADVNSSGEVDIIDLILILNNYNEKFAE